MSNYYIVGCGGVGGWVIHALVKTLTKRDTLILIDKDVLEEKNIDRQLFKTDDIGQTKASAMHNLLVDEARCKIEFVEEYINIDNPDVLEGANPRSWIIVGADNHPARAAALHFSDKLGSSCIIAANEYEDAEAYMYKPEWKDGPLDPRIYYPELLTETEGDPLRPPCTGEILESAPQLAIANMCAASYAMWLLWFWREKAQIFEEEDDDIKGTVPIKVNSTAGRLRAWSLKEMKEAQDGNSNSN